MGSPVDASRTAEFGTDVTIFDTTLRDGEQSPGISLDAREKVEIAEQLARLNVDVIEAGFSAASPGDFDAVKAVAEEVGNATRPAEADGEVDREPPVIAALARAMPGDIEAAAKSLAPAARHRIHTFLSTSDIHRRYMLQASEDDILAAGGRGDPARPHLHRRRRVLAAGRHAHRLRVPGRHRGRGRRGRRHDGQHPRHRRLRASPATSASGSPSCTSASRTSARRAS